MGSNRLWYDFKNGFVIGVHPSFFGLTSEDAEKLKTKSEDVREFMSDRVTEAAQKLLEAKPKGRC